jgi:hypothetical protein
MDVATNERINGTAVNGKQAERRDNGVGRPERRSASLANDIWHGSGLV